MWNAISHIQDLNLMLYEFKLGHKKNPKNICAKGDGIVDHSIVTRWFKKFCSGCKNHDNKSRLGKPKTVDSVLQAKGANLLNSTQRILGKFGISQSSVGCHLQNFGKSIHSYQIVPYIIKIFQEYSPMDQETWVHSQVASYQKL